MHQSTCLNTCNSLLKNGGQFGLPTIHGVSYSWLRRRGGFRSPPVRGVGLSLRPRPPARGGPPVPAILTAGADKGGLRLARCRGAALRHYLLHDGRDGRRLHGEVGPPCRPPRGGDGRGDHPPVHLRGGAVCPCRRPHGGGGRGDLRPYLHGAGVRRYFLRGGKDGRPLHGGAGHRNHLLHGADDKGDPLDLHGGVHRCLHPHGGGGRVGLRLVPPSRRGGPPLPSSRR